MKSIFIEDIPNLKTSLYQPEVNQGREGFDGVTFGQLRILDFNHMYAKDIALVINKFQALQYLITDITIDLIWNENKYISNISHF